MKHLFILIISVCLTMILQAQVSKTVAVTSGKLSELLTGEEKKTITQLTLTGSMDARDFKTLHDEVHLLRDLDIRGVTIEAFDYYYETELHVYPANTIPYAHHWNADHLTDHALAGHTNLTSIKFPASLTGIGYMAFTYCTSLKFIEIPSPIARIESLTFYSCEALEAVIIPATVTYIGEEAFSGCTGLESIRCYAYNPPELDNTYANYPVFAGVDQDSCKLYVPFGTKERYRQAYEYGDFKNIIEMPGISLSAQSINFKAEKDSASTVEILSNKPWTASSDQSWLTITPTFGDASHAVSIVAAPNRTNMGRIAKVTITADTISQNITVFQKGLSTPVTIEAGTLSAHFTRDELNSINWLTIDGKMDARDFKTMRDLMPRLSVIDLSHATIMAYSGVEGTANQLNYKANEIPRNAFYNHETLHAKGISSIRLPETTTAINEYAFYYCYALTTVESNSPITYIGHSAFSYCGLLKTVHMPVTAVEIGQDAFLYGIALSDLGLATVSNIGNYAFYKCYALKSIHFSSTSATIGQGAFRECSSLAAVHIPSSMDTIQPEAFSYCTDLQELTFEPGVTSIEDGAFSNCAALSHVELPNTLSVLRHDLFSYSGLTSIVIPSSVTEIGVYAFYGCSKLSSVTIPASVSIIELHAFFDCTALTSIYMYRQIPIYGLNTEPFLNVNKTACTLYVPYGSKKRYIQADDWKEFKNIVEMPGFSLSADTVSIGKEQDSRSTVTIDSNILWSASSDRSWLSVSPGSGIGSQPLTFTADVNTADTTRMAIVTVSAPETDAQTITITQKGLTTEALELAQNKSLINCYPNPFTQQMTIEIANPSHREVSVDIFSMTDQKIRSLAKALKEVKISLSWDGADEQGRQVAKGIYLVKINGEVRKVAKN